MCPEAPEATSGGGGSSLGKAVKKLPFYTKSTPTIPNDCELTRCTSYRIWAPVNVNIREVVNTVFSAQTKKIEIIIRNLAYLRTANKTYNIVARNLKIRKHIIDHDRGGIPATVLPPRNTGQLAAPLPPVAPALLDGSLPIGVFRIYNRRSRNLVCPPGGVVTPRGRMFSFSRQLRH